LLDEDKFIFECGKHNGKTFLYVYENDFDYCEYITNRKIKNHNLISFKKYLKDKRRSFSAGGNYLRKGFIISIILNIVLLIFVLELSKRC